MRIGVITEEVNNEDVAIALKEAGEKHGSEVVIINPNDCVIVNSDKPQVLFNGSPLTKLDVCLVRGSESKIEFKVNLVEYIAKMGTVMINEAEAIKICNNKFDTQTRLNAIGLKTPKTVSVLKIEQLEASVKILEDKFPMIIKTVSGSHGVGVIKVDTFESLKSITQLLFAKGMDLMLQEFIDHKESGRIMTLGDKVLASVMRSIPEGDFRSNMDQGAQLSAYQATSEEAEVALKVAKELGCIFSAIDYIKNEDGEMVIFEANSSPGFKGIQSVNDEVDIADEVIQFAMSLINKTETKPNEKSTEETEKEVETEVEVISDEEEEETEKESSQSYDSIGVEEEITIKRINNDIPFVAKIDTGADRCSLAGGDVEVDDVYVKFTLNEIRYKVPLERHVTVIAANGKSQRPIVKFNVEFNGKTYNDIEFNIAERSHMKYQVIIGKDLLSQASVVIDPTK